MNYKIKYKNSVFDDFKRMPRNVRNTVTAAIVSRLTVNPHKFKPLKGDWKGCYRLRVGNYRIIYEIHEKEITVLVIKIGIRGNVY